MKKNYVIGVISYGGSIGGNPQPPIHYAHDEGRELV